MALARISYRFGQEGTMDNGQRGSIMRFCLPLLFPGYCSGIGESPGIPLEHVNALLTPLSHVLFPKKGIPNVRRDSC